MGFPGRKVVKSLPAKADHTGDMSLVSGWGRCPGEGNSNPLQSGFPGNFLAWKIPWTEKLGWPIVHGVAKSQTRLSNWAHIIYGQPSWTAYLQRHRNFPQGLVSFFFSFYCFYLFIFWLYWEAYGISVPKQGSNLYLLHWKWRVLTAGPPEVPKACFLCQSLRTIGVLKGLPWESKYLFKSLRSSLHHEAVIYLFSIFVYQGLC